MENEKSENYLREIIFIIFSQKRIIIWTVVLVFLISVLIAFFLPATYSAKGSVLLRGKKLEKSPEALEQMDMRSTEVTREDLVAEAEMIKSPSLIKKTLETLMAKDLYDFGSKTTTLNKKIHDIKKFSLKVAIMPTSNVIEIVFLSKKQEFAVQFLQTLMNEYLKIRLNMYHPKQMDFFYKGQASRFKDELTKKEDKLFDLVEKSGFADPLVELQKNMDIKGDLEKNLIKLKAEEVEKRMSIEQLSKTLGEKKISFFSFIDNKVIISLSFNFQEAMKERAQLLRTYKAQSKKIQLIDKQVKDSYSTLIHEVSAYRDNEEKKLETLNMQIMLAEATIKNTINRDVALKRELIKQQRINREINLREASYTIFAKRQEEASLAKSGNVPSLVSVLNKAFPSDGAVFPKKRVVLPLGLVAGFLLGFSFGFMRHYFDHTFKRPADIKQVVGLNILFSIPFYEEAKHKIVKPKSPANKLWSQNLKLNIPKPSAIGSISVLLIVACIIGMGNIYVERKSTVEISKETFQQIVELNLSADRKTRLHQLLNEQQYLKLEEDVRALLRNEPRNMGLRQILAMVQNLKKTHEKVLAL